MKSEKIKRLLFFQKRNIIYILVTSLLLPPCISTETHLPSNIFSQKRQNFCYLHRKVEQGELLLENALVGLNITASTFVDPESKPNIGVMMLDAVSKRAGFEWRNSYDITARPAKNETYTDVLLQRAHDYDIVLAWWVRSVERLGLGVVFTEFWYDADTIMVQKKAKEEEYFNLFALFLPFTSGLWVLIVFTVLFTGAVNYFLDYLHSLNNKSEYPDDTSSGLIYQNFQIFMGHCNHTSKAQSSRILTLSTCFISLILIAAFTANLANFFISKSSSQIVINSIEDVISNDLLSCSMRGIALTVNFKRNYPHARLLEFEDHDELFIALSEGRCDVGLCTMEVYNAKSTDRMFNKDCDLEWVGRRVSTAQGSFVLEDSEELCSSLFRNALDVHLLRMKQDGIVEEVWKAYHHAITTQLCVEKQKEVQNDDDGRLNTLNLAGVFVFHLILIIVSIVVGLHEHLRSSKYVKSDVKKIVNSAFQKMSISSASIFRASSFNQGKIEQTQFQFTNNNEAAEIFLQTRNEISELREQVKNLQKTNVQILQALHLEDKNMENVVNIKLKK